MKIFIIDTFTSSRFTGNPTAVCLPESVLSGNMFLSVARELNLPVTAFVEKEQSDPGMFSIRYFTTTREIPACGHATLASASILFDIFSIKNTTFRTIEDIIIRTEKNNDLTACLIQSMN